MGDMRSGHLRVLVAAAALLVTTGCGPGEREGHTSAEPETDSSSSAGDSHGTHGSSAEPVKARPLRKGESRLTLEMPEPYTPSAPTGFGTDDYRCFLLDPKLGEDAWITGTNVLPGNRNVVHHVILFRVPPRQVTQARELDEGVPGEGWTCFGGTGLDAFQGIDDAPWLGAWAPGGAETVNQAGYGVRFDKGSQIVMQVHYNLLAGDDPDVSATQLRLAAADADLTNLGTMLLPGPVELPCRPGHDASPLCDRDAAVADVKKRFGEGAGSTADLLYFLCVGKPRPGDVQSCTRTLREPMTIMGVAGHMHLLGRSIKIEVNPGTDRAQTVMDIPIWDFDNQGAKPVKPVHLDTWDTVKVTCEHTQSLRDQLPSFKGQEERYVVWGEGTTDEMCLGILQVTKP